MQEMFAGPSRVSLRGVARHGGFSPVGSRMVTQQRDHATLVTDAVRAKCVAVVFSPPYGGRRGDKRLPRAAPPCVQDFASTRI